MLRFTRITTIVGLALVCLAIGFKVSFKHTGNIGWQEAEEITTQLVFSVIWVRVITFLIKHKKESKQKDDEDTNGTEDDS